MQVVITYVLGKCFFFQFLWSLYKYILPYYNLYNLMHRFHNKKSHLTIIINTVSQQGDASFVWICLAVTKQL